MWRFLFVSAALAVTYVQTTQVTECIFNAAELPIRAHIENCYTSPCLVPQLENITLNIVFEAPRTIDSMRTLLEGYVTLNVGVLLIFFNLKETAITCNYLTNTQCPVLEDEVVMYTTQILMESFIAVDTLIALELRVVDQSDNTPVFCLRTNIKVTPPLGKAIAASNNSTVN